MAEIEAFVKGTLTTPQEEIAVVHAAVGAMKDIKCRADFEVYLKKFLQSLNERVVRRFVSDFFYLYYTKIILEEK